MAYNGITNAGAEYLATRQANNLPVIFLKAKIGNGIVPAGTNPADLTDIVSEKMEIELKDIEQIERTLRATVQVSNETVSAGFYLTEIAIFVSDNGTPVLYWYNGKDNGTYVPDSSKPMKFKNIINIEVSSTPVTTVNYTGKDLWVDEERAAVIAEEKETEVYSSISGLPYDGFVQDPIPKVINRTYRDKNTGYILKCIKSGNVTVPSTEFFASFSNNDLFLSLGKLYSNHTGSISSRHGTSLEFYRIQINGTGTIPWTINTQGNPIALIAVNGGQNTANLVTSFRIENSNRLVGGDINIVSSPAFVNALVVVT